MLKFIVVLHRKKGLTPEQFRSYFIEVHQLLAQKIPGLRRYKQNFVLPDPKRERPAWDCVVELYFDNREAMEAAWASPEGQTATVDLEVFADLSRTAWSVVEERIVVRQRNGGAFRTLTRYIRGKNVEDEVRIADETVERLGRDRRIPRSNTICRATLAERGDASLSRRPVRLCISRGLDRLGWHGTRPKRARSHRQ